MKLHPTSWDKKLAVQRTTRGQNPKVDDYIPQPYANTTAGLLADVLTGLSYLPPRNERFFSWGTTARGGLSAVEACTSGFFSSSSRLVIRLK